jgi:hypothetical protein
MSKPDPSTILQNAQNHASSDAHLPDLSTLWQNASNNAPTDPTSHEHWTPTNPQTPNSLSQADLHAGAGIINDASGQVDSHATLPDLVTLTGHDWFFS